MEKSNIVLIGLSGVGKSTIGKAFAQHIGYQFLDTDVLLKKQTKQEPQTLLDTYGEAVFLEKENQVLVSLYAQKTVIATGGSAIYSRQGMAHLKQLGLVIYLKDTPANIRSRVKRLDQRGIVMAGEKTMSALMRTRQSLYEEMADVVFQMPFPFNIPLSVTQLSALVFNTPLKASFSSHLPRRNHVQKRSV